MPITDNEPEYQMPDGIRDLFTKEMIEDIHAYVSSWYVTQRKMKNEEFTYWGFYVYVEGNGVWSDALHTAFNNANLSWLVEYYRHLPWYERDLFDSQVGDMLLHYNIIEPGEKLLYEDNDDYDPMDDW